MEAYMNANYRKWKELKYGSLHVSHLPDYIAVERGDFAFNPLNLITYPIGWGLYALTWPFRN